MRRAGVAVRRQRRQLQRRRLEPPWRVQGALEGPGRCSRYALRPGQPQWRRKRSRLQLCCCCAAAACWDRVRAASAGCQAPAAPTWRAVQVEHTRRPCFQAIAAHKQPLNRMAHNWINSTRSSQLAGLHGPAPRPPGATCRLHACRVLGCGCPATTQRPCYSESSSMSSSSPDCSCCCSRCCCSSLRCFSCRCSSSHSLQHGSAGQAGLAMNANTHARLRCKLAVHPSSRPKNGNDTFTTGTLAYAHTPCPAHFCQAASSAMRASRACSSALCA